MREQMNGVPRTTVNAVIVAAMREHAYSAEWAQRLDGYQWCDMAPVVTYTETLAEPNRWGDSWVVEVQYSTRGGRAVYGVSRDNVPQCYMD